MCCSFLRVYYNPAFYLRAQRFDAHGNWFCTVGARWASLLTRQENHGKKKEIYKKGAAVNESHSSSLKTSSS